MYRPTLISRRAFVGSALALSATATVRPGRGMAATPPDAPVAPVRVDPNRVIRTIVGLRPYRSAGFVLRAQRLGAKVLVHNYGHGGGGFSLSWGCATLAADLVADRSPARAAVLGCGVIGLTTARTLQNRGWQVTIYAAGLPPATTSNVAGAQWSPVSVFAPKAVTPAFMDAYRSAARIANRAFQLMVGPAYGVRWLDNYDLKRDSTQTGGELANARRDGIEDLYPDVEAIDPATLPFAGFKSIHRFSTMLMEPNTFLPAIQRDFLIAGGRIVVRTFRKPAEIARLAEPVVFNCTGLGARNLFGDTELGPVRGQLSFLEPQPEIAYCYLAPVGDDSLYMFPRSDGIALGGTFQHDNWSTSVDRATETRILEEHATIFTRPT
jgi:D-amino-acid oxidase